MHYINSITAKVEDHERAKRVEWCLYCTKLAPISKIGNVPRAERVVTLN